MKTLSILLTILLLTIASQLAVSLKKADALPESSHGANSALSNTASEAQSTKTLAVNPHQ
jgi:hypothetical protein